MSILWSSVEHNHCRRKWMPTNVISLKYIHSIDNLIVGIRFFSYEMEMIIKHNFMFELCRRDRCIDLFVLLINLLICWIYRELRIEIIYKLRRENHGKTLLVAVGAYMRKSELDIFCLGECEWASAIDLVHALPVGDAALANEFARVAANGERISCGVNMVKWLWLRSVSVVSMLLLPASTTLSPFVWFSVPLK